jgi:hypothetical protein
LKVTEKHYNCYEIDLLLINVIDVVEKGNEMLKAVIEHFKTKSEKSESPFGSILH